MRKKNNWQVGDRERVSGNPYGCWSGDVVDARSFQRGRIAGREFGSGVAGREGVDDGLVGVEDLDEGDWGDVCGDWGLDVSGCHVDCWGSVVRSGCFFGAVMSGRSCKCYLGGR